MVFETFLLFFVMSVSSVKVILTIAATPVVKYFIQKKTKGHSSTKAWITISTRLTLKIDSFDAT